MILCIMTSVGQQWSSPPQPQDDSGSQGAKNACFERIEWSRKALDPSVTQ